MAQYSWDIERPGGETGKMLVDGLNNNFDELYSGVAGNTYIIKDTDNISSSAWWSTDTIYEIVADHDFGGATVTLPANVVLLFKGGVWSNGIINGNNSNFAVNGLIKSFETTLTFTGKWVVEKIFPQWYGAITNASTSSFTNDCTAILQKCFDSLFNVYIPMGFYYVASSIIFTQKTRIVCNDNLIQYADAVCSEVSHTRFFTDQDIDVFIIRSSGVCLFGGVVDISRAASFTKSVIKYDTNYGVASGELQTKIYGSKSKLIAGTHTGKGIYFNLDEATVNYGYIQNIKINITTWYVKLGMHIGLLAGGVTGNYVTLLEIIQNHVGCKQNNLFEDGSGIKCTGWDQADLVCSLAESLVPAIHIKCTSSVFDLYEVDYGKTSGGLYSNSIRVRNEGSSNIFTGKSNILINYGYIQWYKQPLPASIVDNPRTLRINHAAIENQTWDTPSVSEINNQFAYILQKEPAATVNLYSGAGYDFDANLTESSGQPAAVSMVASSLSSLLNYRGNMPYVTCPNDTGRFTDFVEVVIPFTNLYTHPNLLEVYLYQGQVTFNRIQAIFHSTDLSVAAINIYPYTDGTTLDFFKYIISKGAWATYFSKIIIRFIGLSAVTVGVAQKVGISDIFSPGKTSLIDLGGGQTIYGTLKVTGGTKETTLPVYADNAAAKAGGLVDGDPYRTATGIRMVVYT